MDKSRSRDHVLKEPIIQRADLQSNKQRIVFGSLTVVFWFIWIYLWTPVLALLAWGFGVQQAYKYMIVLEGYHELFRIVLIYIVVIAAMGGGLIAWASYNIVRFGGNERRIGNLEVTSEEIARDFGMDAAAVKDWQSAQRLWVIHDTAGGIVGVDILPSAARPQA